ITENNAIKGVVLSANKDYYGQKKPYIDQIVFRFYPDSQSALQAYKNGQVQGIGSVTPDILRSVLADSKLQTFTVRQPQLTMVLFNLKSQDASFLQDASVRKALLSGLNRQAIIDRYLKSQAVVADGPILPDTWAYYSGLKHVSFDPEGAKAALNDAGYVLASPADLVRKKGDVALRLQLSYPDDDSHKTIAEAIQRNWTALGMQVTLEPVPYDTLLKDRLGQRTYQAALIDLNLSRSPDPDPYPFWDQAQASGGQNYTQWDNRIASEYLEQARVTVDMAARAKYYQNFQILFAQEMPALPLFYPMYTYAVDKEVQGVRVGPLFDTADRFANVTDWFLAGRTKTENVVVATNKP
ncbi:MAG TPA: ABC transporter substrate-binding protein, partial [Anaerolineaceae bacterium]